MRFKIFFSFLFLTTLLPYLPYLMPFLSGELLGYNLTGWSWLLMLLISLLTFPKQNISFPIWYWFPWCLMLIIHLVFKFSFLGLQLSLQYLLPIIVGIIASSFKYTQIELRWLFKRLSALAFSILSMFFIGYFFREKYTPATAATPMFFTILFTIFLSAFFITKRYIFIFGALSLLIAPILDVTRMGILAMLSVLLFHFANKKISNRILFILFGFIIAFFVFNSKRFQEKTFYSGKGKITELSFDYYQNEIINTSGRSSFIKALDPGLKDAPVFGNGPRADNLFLAEITGKKSGEAHNDYIAVRYNYGYVGLGLLLFGFLFTFYALLKMFIKIKNERRTFLYMLITSSLTLFIPFFLFMASDNILKYTIYFPNYFFTIIGISVSIYQTKYQTQK